MAQDGTRFDRPVAELRYQLAGLDLTDGERRTMEWIERWESDTVANVASVIRKARAAGWDAAVAEGTGG